MSMTNEQRAAHVVECHAQATRRDWSAGDHRLYGLVLAALGAAHTPPEWCNAPSPKPREDDEPYVCTLRHGHAGNHVAEDIYGQVQDSWSAAPTPPADPPGLVALRHALWNFAGTIIAVADDVREGADDTRRIALCDNSPLVGYAREVVARFGLSNQTAPPETPVEPPAAARVCEWLGSEPPAHPETKHWLVSVERNGENLVTIESACLSGKPEFTSEEADTIRGAAEHLVAFIGPTRPETGTRAQLATLRELADDLERIVGEVSSRDGDATARQHQRAVAVRAAAAALAVGQTKETP